MKWGFPVGLVVKDLPASAGDRGSIPGAGRFHMPPVSQARGPQLLTLEPTACAAQETPPPGEVSAPTRGQPPLPVAGATRGINRDPAQPNINTCKKKKKKARGRRAERRAL